jgi:hypothetical protein
VGIREELVGTWTLVSFEHTGSDGTIVSTYGERPVGLLMYDAQGYMSAQIMDARRPRFASGNRRIATEHELREAVAGYVAYFGRYYVDEDGGFVVHEEIGDIFPNAAGTSQKRYFRLEGDLLVLTTPPYLIGNVRSIAQVIWKRAHLRLAPRALC